MMDPRKMSAESASQGLTAAERVTKEDLVLFINACFACTGQSEFYGATVGQQISIRFLHEYVRGNYRRLYAQTLAANINHFNQALILTGLLDAGAPSDGAQRAEEGELLLGALLALPPQRAYNVLRELRRQRINNRRARALIRTYLARRPDAAFDAVKYRADVRSAAAHAHLRLPPEHGQFLFSPINTGKRGAYTTPLFEAFRRAHYSAEALYELPYTIALGLSQRHRVPRDEFLRRIEPRLTAGERLRLLGTAEREGVELELELGRAPLTRLCLYILSLSPVERIARQAELHAALTQSAERARRRSARRLGRVAAVLDRSYSTVGSSEKHQRPLAVALGASALLRESAAEYRAFWTPSLVGDAASDELLVTARGQTDLATPLLDALAWQPDLVVIVSDGYENDPTGAASEIARAARRFSTKPLSIVHMNPVFDSERYAPRALGPALPTLGLRDAEDLVTLLGFARFADGTAPLSELEEYLATRVARLRKLARGEGSP